MSDAIAPIPQPRFAIGQIVYVGTAEARTEALPCPDCSGTHLWKALSPAGAEYDVACPRCGGLSRYLPRLSYTTWVPNVRQLTIGSIRIDTAARNCDYVAYMCYETGIGSGTIWYEKHFTDTEDAAISVAAAEAAVNNAKERSVQEDQTIRLMAGCRLELALERAAGIAISDASRSLGDVLDLLAECYELLDDIQDGAPDSGRVPLTASSLCKRIRPVLERAGRTV